ncbi:alanyl-tRNA editing protein [Paenibacillus dakarensis]|uniref:alanyl-tRNA editing protein n=1 Tax=Paenibacillus dakarensis TaxID=1527293 RepID=UPI0006D548BC|nr:alanyl-tRNA editing protein [Paenibacillus dakarensis]
MKKLYYDSAYLTAWTTEVKETAVREDGVFVVLKETVFYPNGGGQPCDFGIVNGIAVTDVMLEEGIVYHKLESSLPAEGTVSCQIDWERRFDHMQQHSGQHLLSAVCRSLYQAHMLSFHLGSDYCTIDVDKPHLDAEQLNAIERVVNRQIATNHPIKSYFVTEEEANHLIQWHMLFSTTGCMINLSSYKKTSF